MNQLLPDYFGDITRAYEHGEDRKKHNALSTLAGQFYGGQIAPEAQPQFMADVARNGGPAAAAAMNKEALSRAGQLASMFETMDEPTRQQAYPQLAQAMHAAGIPVPGSYDPTKLPLISKFAQSAGFGGGEGHPMNVSPGGVVVGADGREIYRNTNFAPPRPVYDAQRGMLIYPGQEGAAQGQGGLQASGAPPQGNSDAVVATAQYMAAHGVPDAAIEAWIAQQPGMTPVSDGAAPRGGGRAVQVAPPRPDYQAERMDLARRADARAERAATGADAGPPGDSSLSGDDYLATLPAQMRGLVKAIAEGRQAPPSASSRSPQAQALLQAVYAYDPAANASNLPARTQTRKDFTSGKSAQNIRSLNQAIGHLGLLEGQINGTAGHNFQLLNKAENAAAEQFGSAGVTNYKQTAAALAGELTQVFRGNSGAEADLVRNLAQLSENQSADQKRAAVRNIVGLLNSRVEELGQQYSQGMGRTTDPYSLLNEHAVQVLRRVAPDVAPPVPIRDAAGSTPANTSPAPANGDYSHLWSK